MKNRATYNAYMRKYQRERYSYDPKYREGVLAANKRWREKNPEKIKEYGKTERAKTYKKKYNQSQKNKQYQKKYYETYQKSKAYKKSMKKHHISPKYKEYQRAYYQKRKEMKKCSEIEKLKKKKQ